MKYAKCHTDRKPQGNGLCKQCYMKEFRKRPEAKAKKLKRDIKWQKDNPEKVAIRNAKYRLAHPEKVRAIKTAYILSNSKKIATTRAIYKKANSKKIAAQNALYRLTNLEKIAAQNAKWFKNNPGKARAWAGERRASKIQRTPKWADLKAIRLFYINCPKGYHVDHIIPLRGKNVSGLHILDNLQYLTKSENLSKGNKYGP